MKKLLLLITSLILVIGCSDNPLSSEDLLYFDLDTRLTEDSNGYYHLKLELGSWQTLHRFSGIVTDSIKRYCFDLQIECHQFAKLVVMCEFLFDLII